MLITRKIGKLIRGKATPFQIVSASILGMLIGFTPGFQQAPGLIVFWALLLIILNANIFLAGILALLGKLLLWVSLPIAFALGRFLLEGPTQGFFKSLANGPITAYFGLEYYVVPGGQLIALVVGGAIGIALTRLLAAYRRKMIQVEQNPGRVSEWSSKGWVKALKFIFLGSGKGKKSYQELLSKKWGNPIRVPGLIAAVLIVALGYFGLKSLSDPLITAAIKDGLETANGATVDLKNAHLDLDEGRIEIDGLALADPENLDTNLFASDRIVADISSADILKKRFSIDSLVFENASSGLSRETKGSYVGKRPKTKKESPIQLPDYKDLGSVLEDAPEWKERLAQVKKWLEALGGEGGDNESTSLKETLANRIQSLGYTHVSKTDLIEGSPTVFIRNLIATQVKTEYFKKATLSIEADNLSSHPSLVESDPKIRITSSDDSLIATLTLGAAAGRADNLVDIALQGLSVDSFASKLKSSGQAPISGGTMNLAITGKLSAIDSDLKISPTFNGSTISIGGSQIPADNLSLPLFLRGPIDNPSIKLDSKAMTNAITKAGKKELLNRAAEKLGISSSGTDEEEKLEDKAKKLLGGFLKNKTEEE